MLDVLGEFWQLVVGAQVSQLRSCPICKMTEIEESMARDRTRDGFLVRRTSSPAFLLPPLAAFSLGCFAGLEGSSWAGAPSTGFAPSTCSAMIYGLRSVERAFGGVWVASLDVSPYAAERKVVVGTSKDTQKFWILEGLRGMKIEVGLTHSGTIPVPLTGRPESLELNDLQFMEGESLYPRIIKLSGCWLSEGRNPKSRVLVNAADIHGLQSGRAPYTRQRE